MKEPENNLAVAPDEKLDPLAGSARATVLPAPESLEGSAPPLVVDLDGTLTPTDTLLESIVSLLKRNPLLALMLPVWLLEGRAAFKSKVAAHSHYSARGLPFREALVSFLQEEKSKGRTLVLATAAHRSIAEPVAAELGLFDKVIATDDVNLKGRAKLQAIHEQVGKRFSYAGDSAADVEIWKQSESAVIIGSPRGSAAIRQTITVEREFPNATAGILVWLRAMRAHQWIKNLLLFVPLLTSFAFLDGDKDFAATLAFVAFCLAASATYLVNDLWDLENDRLHHRKRHRPLASARIGIPTALAVAAVLLISALAIAWFVNTRLLVALVAYLILTSAYSWTLKKVMLIDVLVLASLYTLRILAGSFAIGVHTSSWLLVFSIFMFFSLALVKRCSELVAIGRTSQTSARGRNYRVSDLAVLWPMGIGAGLCSVIVFAMFISTMETARKYESPHLMWLVVVGLVYWVSRLWIKTARGEMHDDPLVFAIKDFGSRFTVAAMIAVTVVAYFFELEPQ